jgi:hypothetical protein
MYDIIQRMIGHKWVTGSSDQQYIYYICGALIVLFTLVFIDMVYRIFRHFWR